MVARSLLVLSLLCLVALIAGCGGGSDQGGWDAYSPPSDVISPEQLQTLAVQELFAVPRSVLSPLSGDFSLFGFGRVPAITNMLGALLDEVLGDLPGLFAVRASHQLSGDARILALMKAGARGGASSTKMKTADADGLFFDWTDPETEIHWTGRVLERNGALLPTLRGVGPRTNCTVTLTLVFELGSRATVSGTIRGPIAALVDIWDPRDDTLIPSAAKRHEPESRSGRAELDCGLDLQVNLIAGQDASVTASTRLIGDFQLWENGAWESFARQDTRLALEGLLGDSLQVSVSGTDAHGRKLGSGLYWTRHMLSGSLLLPLGADEPPTMTFSDEITYSDGKRGGLMIGQIDSHQGDIQGFVRAANGESLVTITGYVLDDAPPMAHWADGTETPVAFF